MLLKKLNRAAAAGGWNDLLDVCARRQYVDAADLQQRCLKGLLLLLQLQILSALPRNRGTGQAL